MPRITDDVIRQFRANSSDGIKIIIRRKNKLELKALKTSAKKKSEIKSNEDFSKEEKLHTSREDEDEDYDEDSDDSYESSEH